MKPFKRIINALRGVIPCNCSLSVSEDPLCGKYFKHYKNKKLYKYLFVAQPKTKVEINGLVVVYQDIESKMIYTRSWNEFFASVGAEANRVPRFMEQD